MNGLNRQKTQTHSQGAQSPQLESHDINTMPNPLANFLGALQQMILPLEVWLMPYLDDGKVATHWAISTGKADAGSNPGDAMTRTMIMPNQGTVVSYVSELSETVGRRAFAIIAALQAGTLTPPLTPTTLVTGWKATSLRTKALMLVAFVLEVVFGAKMAERLAGSGDWISWAIGLAIATVFTMCSLAVAAAIHTKEPGLLRGRGSWVALGLVILAVLFLGLYAWGLGGGAEAQPSGTGLAGGSAPGDSAPPPGQSENWALVLIYGSLLLLLLASVVVSHIIDLYGEDVKRVNADMLEKNKVLTPEAQKQLSIRLLLECLILVDQAKHRAQGLVLAYVGGVRTILPPAYNAAWQTGDLERLDLPNPAWVPKIEAEIRRLKGEVTMDPDDTDPEPFSLVRDR